MRTDSRIEIKTTVEEDEFVCRKGTIDEKMVEYFPEGTTGIEFLEGKGYGEVVLDVGAHIGLFTVYAAKRGRKVYAVEACEDSYNMLRLNVALNQQKWEEGSVHLSRVALGEKDGFIKLYDGGDTWGHSVYKRGAEGEVEKTEEVVPSLSLKSYLRKNGLKKVDFMKMNCEGSEFDIILNSDNKTLKRFDKMVIDFHCDICTDYGKKDLLEKLEEAGFVCKIQNEKPGRGCIVARRS